MEEKPSTLRIDEVLELSATMLRLAETGDWEGLTQLAQDRHRALADLFSSPSEQLAGCVEEIQEIDRQILEHATTERRLLSGRLSAFEKRRRANAAYVQVAAD